MMPQSPDEGKRSGTQLTLPIDVDASGERRLPDGWLENELDAPAFGDLADEERRLILAVGRLGRIVGQQRVVYDSGNEQLAAAIPRNDGSGESISSRTLRKWRLKYCRPGFLNCDEGKGGRTSQWTLFLGPILERDPPSPEPTPERPRHVDAPGQRRLAFTEDLVRPPLWWRVLAWFLAAIRPGSGGGSGGRLPEVPEVEPADFRKSTAGDGAASGSETSGTALTSGTRARGDPEVPAAPHEVEVESESEHGPPLNSTQGTAASGKPLAKLTTERLQAAVDGQDADLVRETLARYRIRDSPQARQGIIAAARCAIENGKPPAKLFRHLAKSVAWERPGKIGGIAKQYFEVEDERQPSRYVYDGQQQQPRSVTDW